jgi:transcriptional regulator of acetoin/glycerol metabolism
MAQPDIVQPPEMCERDAIVRALQLTKGNKQQAAKLLQMSRGTLYRRLRDHGLEKLIRRPLEELQNLL